MTKPVTDYERRGVLDYPGRRNEVNFITDGQEVIDLSPDNATAITQIEEYLQANHLPGLEERIPVLAYGANVSPGNLATKFDKYATDGTQVSSAEMKTVPNLYVNLKGSDIVWHGAPGGYAGGYFAEIYHGTEAEDTTVKAVIQFLTPEQLGVMHTTEGDTYGISVTEGIDLGNGQTIDAVSYVARKASVLLDEEGKPIAVQGIERHNSSLEVMDPRGALDYTLGIAAVREAVGVMSPDEYIETNKALTPAEKSARQRAVRSALEAAGRSREMRHPTIDTNNYGRANFISLPRGVKGRHADPRRLELLETSLARLRPEVGARTIDTDPVLKLRRQASTELQDSLRAAALAAKQKR